MKGVIIAGGLGTRVGASTLIANKHCLPIYDRPMIHYPLATLKQLGCKEVAIIFSPPFGNQIITLIGNGSQLGINVTYLVQTKPDGGIADALMLAEGFANNESIVVVLGDNVMEADGISVDDFRSGCRIFLKEVPNPEEFGVAEFSRGSLVGLVEKPTQNIGNKAIIGLYLYDLTVFDKIRKCRPSLRGQLEITDVNDLYLKEKSLQWRLFNGSWQDCGTPDKMLLASLHQQSQDMILKEISDLSNNIQDLIRLTKDNDWDFEGGVAITKDEWLKLYRFIRDIVPVAANADPIIFAQNDGTYRLEFNRSNQSIELMGKVSNWRVKDGSIESFNADAAALIIKEFLKGDCPSGLVGRESSNKIEDIPRVQKKLMVAYRAGLASLALLNGTEFSLETDDNDPLTFQITTRLDSIYKKLSEESIAEIEGWIAAESIKELCKKIRSAV